MKKNKLLYRSLILAVFLLLNLALLFGIGQVLSYLNTGADRASILHLDLEREFYYQPKVVWTTTDQPGRPLEKENQQKIEQDYLDAWFVKNQALSTGSNEAIEDHFTSTARQHFYELQEYNNAQNLRVEATSLSHHLTLDFYNADGTLVVLTDRNVKGIEEIYKYDQFLQRRSFLNDYRVVMLLEDGFWRIHQFEKIAAHPIPTKQKSQIPLDGPIAGMNYYPQDLAWNTFDKSLDQKTLTRDFKTIKELNLNSIRIFLKYQDFQNAQQADQKIQKLQLLLDSAHKANLKVMVTLFDFYGNYQLDDYTLSNAYLRRIVPAIQEHPALYAWDIKNEPDLDYQNRGKREVQAWLSQSIDVLKSMDSLHPVTIGWSKAQAALDLEEKVDLVSYHYYQDLDKLSQTHQELISKTSKPVILQEIGWSSYDGFWNPFGLDQDEQAEKMAAFYKIQKRDEMNHLFWTLYDFKEIPTEVAGSLPWRKNKQAHFGVIDTAGAQKPVFNTIKRRGN